MTDRHDDGRRGSQTGERPARPRRPNRCGPRRAARSGATGRVCSLARLSGDRVEDIRELVLRAGKVSLRPGVHLDPTCSDTACAPFRSSPVRRPTVSETVPSARSRRYRGRVSGPLAMAAADAVRKLVRGTSAVGLLARSPTVDRAHLIGTQPCRPNIAGQTVTGRVRLCDALIAGRRSRASSDLLFTNHEDRRPSGKAVFTVILKGT